MQDAPLLVSGILRHGQRVYGDSQVVTVEADGYRTATFAEVAARAEQLAAALGRLGVRRGDRVGTFCWNNQTHIEAYLAVPSMGAVLHTLNIRLFPEQLAYVVNHAEDRVIIVDASLIAAARPGLRRAEDGRDGHRGGGGGHLGPRRDPVLRRAPGGRGARLRLARRSTNATPRPCATRAAPPATPRASSTATARRGCTPWPQAGDGGRRHVRERPAAGHRADVPRQRLGHALRVRG